MEDGSKESLAKSKLLVGGLVRKIRAVHLDDSDLPNEVVGLVQLQEVIEKQLKALE